jgi:hypothetical protein
VVGCFPDHQDFIVPENRSTYIDFWSCVVFFTTEQGQYVLYFLAGLTGKYLGGYLANLLEPLDVKLVFSIGKAILCDGLESFGPFKPVRVVLII